MAKTRKAATPTVFETAFAVYKVAGSLGKGRTSRIFKCTDECGNMWAVKLFDPHKTTREKIRRIKSDLMFCLRNRHSNIVTVIDYGLCNGEEGPSPFYVMPLYNGIFGP